MHEEYEARVAVLTNSPAPYRDQLFRRLRPYVASLDVFFTHPPSRDRAWTTDPVPSDRRLKRVISFGQFGYFNWGVFRVVRQCDVVIVGGYDQPSYVLALIAARAMRKRSILIFDGLAPSRLHRRGVLTALKSITVRQASVCLVNGSIGVRYFHDRLRVPSARIRNQFLVPVLEPTTGSECEKRYDVVFVGRLIERKGVGLLIDALRTLPGISAAIVGDGPMMRPLMGQAEGLDIDFLGELRARQVATTMRCSSCLVAPSRDEPWGLVVHEAMHVGIPVVVGEDVGCVEDLVVDGLNGIVVHGRSAAELASAITAALALDRAQVTSTNSRVLELWNLDHHVEAFRLAIDER
jgi:glycosyltransferase involved in cell wall biosynthesis